VLPNLVGVEPAPGVEPAALAARITSSVNGVEALDKGTAVDSLPGVSSIRQSFAIILGLAFVVVMLLTGFFFLILTVQKTASLTLLRAAGASSRFLIGSLLLQVAVVTVGAIAVAVPLTYAAVASFSGDFTATVRPAVVVSTCVAIVVLAVIASIAALRRVAAIALRPPRRA
jgi:putative ABC transport system permease protein